jgi:outer membrane usher protein
VTLSWTVAERTTAQTSAGGRPGGATASAGIAQTLPVGPGYAYRVEAEVGNAEPRGSGTFTYQTSFGRYEAQVDQLGTNTLAAVRASGGLVFAGGRMFVTRPVEEAYAVVRVGVPNVTAYLENQEVGTTDGQGDLLVPSLLARYSNRLSIRAADVPLDYEVGPVEQRVAPPRKGGMVVRFDVIPIRAVAGRLRLEAGAGDEAPGGGEIALVQEGMTLRYPTTQDGRFFLEGLRPGPHQAQVTWRGGTCQVTVPVPEKAGLQDLGVLDCDRTVRVASAR